MQVPRKRPDVGTSRKKLTGGGCSKRVIQHSAHRAFSTVSAVVLAVALTFAVAAPRAYAGPLEDAGNFIMGIGDSITSLFAAGDGGEAVPTSAPEGSTKVADPDTRSTYPSSLGENSSTRNDGRVWVDKSVSDGESIDFSGTGQTITVGNDSDFLVTYSALATSTRVIDEERLPVDVVFVIDLSGSMSNGGSVMDNDQKRIENLVASLNESINTLMALNDNTRIGVVGYSNTAVRILPLDHYEKVNGNDIFTCTRRGYGNDEYAEISWNAINGQNSRVRGSQDVTGGTNVQMGIYEGMNMLATENETTAQIDGEPVNRIPSVIVMSDGAATYSSDSQSWWSPDNNNNDGPGSSSYYGNGMKAMMTAAYMKQQIDGHYELTDADMSTAVYTIGVGVSDLTGDDQALAQITLDPTHHWNDNTDIAESVRNAWSSTVSGRDNGRWFTDNGYTVQENDGSLGTPRVNVGGSTGWDYYDSYYELTHPDSGDIVDVGLQYNDEYFEPATAEDIENVFGTIIDRIIGNASVPTEVTGSDPVHDGYIDYEDPIGQYMKVEDVKTLIWSGEEFTNPTRSPQTGFDDNGDATYTFTGDITSPVYGDHNANEIIVTVHQDEGGNQTLRVRIPASAIPVRVNTVTINNGNVVSNDNNNAYPLRLCYTVGLDSELLRTDNKIDAEKISEDYIRQNADGDNLTLYANEFTRADEETGASATAQATVTFTPANDNPFYFIQENTPLYTDGTAGIVGQAGDLGQPATGEFDPSATYYFQISYYEGTDAVTEVVARPGSQLEGYTRTDNGQLNIVAGAPRLGNLDDVTAEKTDNTTGTDDDYRRPTFEPAESGNPLDGHFTVYLGNNGRLVAPFASRNTEFDPDDANAGVQVTKRVIGGDGGTIDPSGYTFTLTVENVTDGANPTDGFTLPNDAESLTGTSDGNGTVTFGDDVITFTETGQYVVTVRENIPSDDQADPSMDYDGHVLTYTVNVTSGETSLVATVDPNSISANEATFYNFDRGESKTATTEDENGDSTAIVDGQSVTVGDEITYHVHWVNNAVDEKGNPATADVVVTDSVPVGTELVEGSVSEHGSVTQNADGTTITWTYESQPFGTEGTASFTVRVTPDALETIENEATIKIGDHEGKVTNTVTTDVVAGELSISKTVVNDVPDSTAGENMDFAFTVIVTDDGQPVAGTFDVSGLDDVTEITFDGEGKARLSLQNGETATISGLPDGASYEVTEDNYADAGFTTTSENASGTIDADATKTAAFTNTYDTSGDVNVSTADAEAQLTKVLEGKAWGADDSFSFQIASDSDYANNADAEKYLPDNITVTVNAATGEDESGNDSATFDFAFEPFDAIGEYHYTVVELGGNNPGITYSKNIAKVTVRVFDGGEGELKATVTIDNSLFTNTYEPGTVDFDDYRTTGGLRVVKNLTGRAIDAEQFTFTMDTEDAASLEKIGGEALEFKTAGASLNGNVSSETIDAKTGLKFDQNDAGKTYTYTIDEVGEAPAGYTYDQDTHELSFVVTDDGKGVLAVEVKLDGKAQATYRSDSTDGVEPVVVTFDNSYNTGGVVIGADGEVQIKATKQLANRPLVDGEFHFVVRDQNNNPVVEGTNDADGVVTFNSIKYTTEKLNADVESGIATLNDGVYTYQYSVAEDQDRFPDGVSAVADEFSITVSITDDGEGHLSAKVTYPQGSDSLTFKNVYGGDNPSDPGTARLNLNGVKEIAVSEPADNAPTLADIAGKYTFTLSAVDGTPMPDKTEAVNDAAGNVDFGEIVYTMANVFGDTGDDVPQGSAASEASVQSAVRTKIFEYTVSESGSVAGIQNDGNQTVKVEVTDHGDGTLTAAVVNDDPTADFTFTNTYSVDSSDPTSPTDPDDPSTDPVEGGMTITKNLTGRDLVDGEFSFQLIDEAGDVVSTGANDAEGNVELTPITFDKPGTYSYTLSEVDGDKGGVDYDASTFKVVAKVTDNGAGKLVVDWSYDTADAVFENTYTADPTAVQLTANKVLTGRDLVEGEFEFQVTDESGEEVYATAKNDADGTIAFDSITLSKAGTYELYISEVLPEDDDPTTDGVQSEGVTFDQNRYLVTVTVEDNGNGQLVVTSDGELPSFTNTYVKPAEPAPEEPTDAMPKTGDTSNVAVIGLGLAAMALVAGGVVLRRRTNR